MANAAAENLAQYVAAPLIRGQYTVVDEEGRRAGVVRDNAERSRRQPLLLPYYFGRLFRRKRRKPSGETSDVGIERVFEARQLRRPINQRRKQICLKVAHLTLQHGGDALQPHSRIDRRLGQRL